MRDRSVASAAHRALPGGQFQQLQIVDLGSGPLRHGRPAIDVSDALIAPEPS
jgi:hypothetical protein